MSTQKFASGPVVVVEGLCKDYGSVRAVDDLSFTIERGEVFALLGPNGAGKTTTVEILEGHRSRSAGTVQVLGFDPATGGRAYRDRIGIVLQEAGFDEQFTVRELVTPLRRSCTRTPRCRRGHRPCGPHRQGGRRARRRCPAASAAVSTWPSGWSATPSCCSSTSPRPASTRRPGAGPGTSSPRCVTSGTTIVLTTHYMEEAERLADRVAVIQSGRLVALDTPTNLVRTEGAEAVITFVLPDGVGPEDLPPIGVGAARTQRPAGRHRLGGSDPRPQRADRVGPCARGIGLEGLTMARPIARGRVPGPHPGGEPCLTPPIRPPAPPALHAVRPGPLRQPRRSGARRSRRSSRSCSR